MAWREPRCRVACSSIRRERAKPSTDAPPAAKSARDRGRNTEDLCTFQRTAELQLQFIMDTDPRRTDGGDLRLDSPGTVNGVPVHRRYPQPPPLVEAQSVEIVVGGYQPQPPAPLRCGYLLRRRQQGTADARTPPLLEQGKDPRPVRRRRRQFQQFHAVAEGVICVYPVVTREWFIGAHNHAGLGQPLYQIGQALDQ